MKPLPMPLRVAAGLVATAIEEAQELPRKLVELPVTAVSQVLQVSMRLQQQVTELAIKGDRALGSLRPVPESPSWARFDEDEPMVVPPANGLANASRTAESQSWVTAGSPPRRVSPVRVVPEPDPELVAASEPEPELVAVTEPVAAEPADAKPVAVESAPVDHESASQPSTATGPDGLEEYEQWSLPQLRGRFRKLTLEQVRALLTWENAHQDRPPYVTMLSNRIASITGR